MGKAFGARKMLDMADSDVGFLLAYVLMRHVGENGYRTVFAVLAIPILIALALFLFVHELKSSGTVARRERCRICR